MIVIGLKMVNVYRDSQFVFSPEILFESSFALTPLCQSEVALP